MIDYLYYKKNYNGKIITNKSEFEKFENLSVRYIKSVINSDIEYKEEDIYDCICAVAEQMYIKNDSQNIKSETVDGYSVTYADNSGKELYETLKLYLPKELLYRGIGK